MMNRESFGCGHNISQGASHQIFYVKREPLTETSVILTPIVAPKTRQPGRATLVTGFAQEAHDQTGEIFDFS